MFAGLTTLSVLLSLAAADAPAGKPLGIWKRSFGDNQVLFTITADGLRCQIRTDNGGTLDIHADYGVTRDGVLFGILTRVEANGAEGPAAGDLFSFRFALEKGVLTIKDLKSPVGADARQLVEGSYRAQEK
jgi:hypothetical protein